MNKQTKTPSKTKVKIPPEQFAKELISNGRNGTKAVQKLNPNLSYEVAAVHSSRMLKKAKVKALLEDYANDAVNTLHELHKDKESTPPETRRKSAVDILHYAGHEPTSKSVKGTYRLEDMLAE